ncbi:cytosolic endo-beta-N-acetylglucosaminidase isoform X2 [Topomyia yanbarensis]|uniref:cytosolic endo-beta-N-acetylglucosaminidase isoform X2 n=1 Tax=Topomyia yanbarensis TaxID=2498891 RepID=UPI00273CC56A|nr:cytosolic endo-beta-N-acetylglucosaminidase isoform X2 [Topomyia yanbarensis]
MINECDVSEEGYVCQPINTIEDLLKFEQHPVSWRNLVLPITPRSKSRYLGERYQEIDFNAGIIDFVDDLQRPQVLLCHDFKGNYLTDRFINGTTGEEWVHYRFYNWAAVDVFCYFSHNFVTIPTLQWLNCAHKNGVKVIGTFIIEGGNVTLLKEILRTEEMLQKVADALVIVARICQFQGWLLNIECTLAENEITPLKDFVAYLTKKSHEQIPGSMIIWYDAITEKGLLSWQNELNSQNQGFFAACDGIFLNYTWSQHHLERSENFIRNYYPERKLDVYVGIDVFGRGQKAKLDTHATLASIMAFKFSVAIFAPGWTFESLEESMQRDQLDQDSSNLRFLKLNDCFWNMLWRYFFVRGPRELPFYTSFCLGSGKIRNRLGKLQAQSWFNLSRQGFQPSIPYTPPREHEQDQVGPVYWTHNFETALDGGSCVKMEEVHPNSRLFACDFSCGSDLIVAYAFQRNSALSADVNLLLKAYNARYHDSLKIVCGAEDCHISERSNEMKAIPLDAENCRMLLELKANVKLPVTASINGWEIRYYYLSFEAIRQPMAIVDIGIEIRKDDPKDYVLLGAISLQAGFPASRDRITKRSFVAFDV